MSVPLHMVHSYKYFTFEFQDMNRHNIQTATVYTCTCFDYKNDDDESV